VACVVLGGCTTSELAYEAQQSAIAAADADDPVLPDTVAVTPSIFSLAEEMETQQVAAAPVAAAAQIASTTEIVAAAPVAYAAMSGSAPTFALAAASPAPGKIAARSPELDALIARYADHHEIPVD